MVLAHRIWLRGPFEALINEHAAFTSLVLTATRFVGPTAPPPPSEIAAKKLRPGSSDVPNDCMLPLLRGHEKGLLSLIADFAGVVRGRPLRNAREALFAFKWLVGSELDDTDTALSDDYFS